MSDNREALQKRYDEEADKNPTLRNKVSREQYVSANYRRGNTRCKQGHNHTSSTAAKLCNARNK